MLNLVPAGLDANAEQLTAAAGGSVLDEIVRDGARQMLAAALQAEVDAYIDQFRTELDESTPCKNNALGVKGVGELGTIGAAPCVVNAVADALARNGRAELAPRVQMPQRAPV